MKISESDIQCFENEEEYKKFIAALSINFEKYYYKSWCQYMGIPYIDKCYSVNKVPYELLNINSK